MPSRRYNLLHAGASYILSVGPLRSTFHVFTKDDDNVGAVTQIALPHPVWEWIASLITPSQDVVRKRVEHTIESINKSKYPVQHVLSPRDVVDVLRNILKDEVWPEDSLSTPQVSDPETNDERCVYCGLPALGYAAGSTIRDRLCHDEQRDCYHVVTVYGGDWARYARTLKFKNQTSFVQGWTQRVEEMARYFHEEYERLAPKFGYETREESAVPWENVPAQNKALMRATCEAVVKRMT